MKDAVVLLLFLFLVTSALAGPDDLEIKLLNEERKEMVAGSTSNVLVRLINHTETIKEVQIELNTPGTNLVQNIKYPSTIIEGKSSINKILNVTIPGKAKSGNYSIEAVALDKSTNQQFGKVLLPVYVKPLYEIRVDKLKAPRFLFSGDTLGVKFLLQNLSNLDVTVAATIVNNKVLENRSYKLPMDSSILVNVPVSIPKDFSYLTMLNVTFTGCVYDKPETESSSSYSFDIIPSANVKFDGYYRFPVKVSGMFAADNRTGKLTNGSMYDILGGGLINDKNKLEFHFRGPDRGGNPTLGLNDEYSINYSNKKTEVFLGDHNFRLSDLTESSRSGRGVKLQQNFNKLSIGSFYDVPRYYPGIKNIYSVYSEYRINDKTRFSAGYLSKEDTTQKRTGLMTLSGFLSPFRWGNTEFEIAAGQHQNQLTKAFRGALNINTSLFNSHFNITSAEPDFPGYVSNSMYVSTGVSTHLFKKLSLSLNYDLNQTNLAVDTLYANAPFSKNLNFLSSFRMNPNNSVNIGFYVSSLEDRAPKPLFNYQKYNGRLAFQSKLGHFNMNIQGDMGKVKNNLQVKNGELTDFYNGYFSLKYAINNSFTTSGFVNYQGGEQYLITGFHRFYYGGSLQSSLKKYLHVSLDYTSNYELQEYFRERSLLSLQMYLRLNKNHEIQLGTNYNLAKNSLEKKELSVLLRYTYTINVPLSKRKDIGSLTGKVLSEDGGNFEGIIFNLDGNIAVTDKKGNFRFPVIKIGSYILAMDESSVGLNTIATIPGPYRVTVEPGKETKFEIKLTKATKIKGRLIIQEDEKSGDKGFYPVKEEIDRLIVEANNGIEIFRILTGRDGTFSFEDLRPGNWRVKIYPNGIPPGFSLDNDQFSFHLDPGKEEKFDVIIRKKSRVIKFQKNL